MPRTVGFRPTEEDEKILRAARRGNENTSEVIRRALRLLEREVWISRARDDAERLADDPVHFLGRDELAEVEQAASHYLGL